jgi:hypothetical protein
MQVIAVMADAFFAAHSTASSWVGRRAPERQVDAWARFSRSTDFERRA